MNHVERLWALQDMSVEFRLPLQCTKTHPQNYTTFLTIVFKIRKYEIETEKVIIWQYMLQ